MPLSLILPKYWAFLFSFFLQYLTSACRDICCICGNQHLLTHFCIIFSILFIFSIPKFKLQLLLPASSDLGSVNQLTNMVSDRGSNSRSPNGCVPCWASPRLRCGACSHRPKNVDDTWMNILVLSLCLIPGHRDYKMTLWTFWRPIGPSSTLM